MKEGLHPAYNQTTITCACGNVIEVGSTKSNLRLDTKGGRAARFKEKYGIA